MTGTKQNNFIYRCDSHAPFIKFSRNLKNYINNHFDENDVGRNYFMLMCASAIRSGYAKYINCINFVPRGSWVGGYVGAKAILGKTITRDNLNVILQELEDKEYCSFDFDNKKLTIDMLGYSNSNRGLTTWFETNDENAWFKNRSGADYYRGEVTAVRYGGDFYQEGIVKNYYKTKKDCFYKMEWKTPDIYTLKNNFPYFVGEDGWVGISKKVFDNRAEIFAERSAKINKASRYKHKAEPFSPCEAFLDLYVHTIYRDFDNMFSWFMPVININNNALTSTSELGKRWGWNRMKVNRFLKEHSDIFQCYSLPSNWGTLIINKHIKTPQSFYASVKNIISFIYEVIPKEFRVKAAINGAIASYSKVFIKKYFSRGVYIKNKTGKLFYGRTIQVIKKLITDNIPVLYEINDTGGILSFRNLYDKKLKLPQIRIL